MPTARPFVIENQLRALATAGQSRSPALPNVTTVAEAMLPDFVFYAWLGLLAPAGTPAPVIDKINKAVSIALADPRPPSGCAPSATRSRAARRPTWAGT